MVIHSYCCFSFYPYILLSLFSTSKFPKSVNFVGHRMCCKGDTPKFPTAGELVAELGRTVGSTVYQIGTWLPWTNERGTEVNCVNPSWGLKSHSHNSPYFPPPCYLQIYLPPLLVSDGWCWEGGCLLPWTQTLSEEGRGQEKKQPP